MDSSTPGRAAPRVISIFDTTLRDGEQAPGNTMTAEQKLDIAMSLEALGVDVIEAGCPASSAEDYKAAQLLADAVQNATIATFCRALPADIESAVNAVGTDRHQVQILATASDVHLVHKRGITRAEAVRELVDAVRAAASLGVTNISAGLEDASRGHPDLLRSLIDGSVAAGATTVAVGDTTGCMTPAEFGDVIARVRDWLPSGTTLAVHCHNDIGLALANALAGVQAGADQVQTTLAGIGERAGNTALEELAAVLHYKSASLGATTRIRTDQLFVAFHALKEAIDLPPMRNKAIFGDNAFATQAGIHQAGMLRKPETYEYVEPERFGRTRSLLIGRQSGRAILRYLLNDMSLGVTDEQLNELYQSLIATRADVDAETLDTARARISEWFTNH